MFRKAILEANGIRFNEKIKYAEDMMFTLDYIHYVDRYAFVDTTGYYYVYRSDSALYAKRPVDYGHDFERFKY